MAIGKYALFSLGLSAIYLAVPKAQSSLPLSFEVPAETAIDRLRAEPRLVQGTGLGSLRITGARMSGESVLISVTRAGDPRSVKCRVHVGASSPTASQAEVDCTQPAAEKNGARALAADALEIVVREHVSATVGQRPYDIDGVADRMIVFAIKNQAALSAEMMKAKPADGNAAAAIGGD